jgi:hypothetical protein
MTDLTVAISKAALEQTLGDFIEIFQFEANPSTSGSPRFGLTVKCHLERGNVSLEPPSALNPIYQGGFFKLTDLVVAWDKLDFSVTVHLPKVGWGEFCLIPDPIFGGCIVKIPGASFFDVDITATIPIDNIIRSRLDLGVAPIAHRVWNSDEQTYQWLVVPQVVWQNVQPIDPGDIVGDLIDGLVTKLVNEALSFLPDWARDIVDAILHGIASFIRGLLNLPADLKSWLSNLIRFSLDPFDIILQLLENYFQNDLSFYRVNDPLALLPEETTPIKLPAVKIPIQDIALTVDAAEFVIGVQP